VAGLLLSYTAVMGCVFIVQGICILKTGDIRGIVARLGARPKTPGKPKVAIRVGCAAIYIGGGVALNTLVIVALLKMRIIPPMVLRSIITSWPHLLGPLSLVLVGTWALIQPSGLLGWAKQAHPDFDVDDPFSRGIARAIGAGVLAIGLIALVAFA
jgi:heme/copper-type cytochrome/quinol oxidase subunit 3